MVTEGVLTARLQHDPLLSSFKTIVLDEFHERSIHADLAIALSRQAWRARAGGGDALRIVVMSATLDAGAVAAFLDGCPVVDVPGRLHPVEISYTPSVAVADAAIDALRATGGQVLCFLPGVFEIRRAIGDLDQKLRGQPVDVVPLHGSLGADEQDVALVPSARRRIIVATNIAETSLTVPGITAVVDSGLHKVARYDADRGIDSLETERITSDAADQRAGRAGRVAPGIVRRLWDATARLRPHREPEVRRVDLASAALDVIAWGGDPRTFEWFERPRNEALEAAIGLLTRLGLIESGRSGVSSGGPPRLTKIGEQVQRLPLHPRLSRMLVAAGGDRSVVRACALLSERHLLPPRTASTTSDLLSALDRWNDVPPHVKQAADHINSTIQSTIASINPQSPNPPIPNQSAIRNPQSAIAESVFLRAVFNGYPDRVAQRREPRSESVKLASGAGAVIAPESGVRDGEFLVALDVRTGRSTERGAPQLASIRIASRIEREWLVPTSLEVVHRFDDDSGTVSAIEIAQYDALVLWERPAAVDRDQAARLLADAWLGRGPRGEDQRLLRRLRFAGCEFDLESAVRTAALDAKKIDDVQLARAIAPATRRDLDRDAPESLIVPSGRHIRLEYNDDGSVSASVKLQELFGLAETPRIGRRREPVMFALLAPNGRPVQLTRDLRSFWDRTYPEVRKELRGRYPKHRWPEDPWK